MQNRGRPSINSLSATAILPAARPDPPAELEPEAAAEWRAITNRLPADWFPRESHSLLVDLCQQIILARSLAAKVSALGVPSDAEALATYDKMVRLKLNLSASIGKLATRLRLTNQSRDGTRTAARKAAAQPTRSQKPWNMGTTSAPRRGSENGNNDVYGWGEP
jgi:hypothetical protein